MYKNSLCNWLYTVQYKLMAFMGKMYFKWYEVMLIIFLVH